MKTPTNALVMQVAFSQFATREIVGANHEPQVVQYFNEVGHSWVKDDETAWCSAFWSWVNLKAGAAIPELNKRLSAQSWLAVGEEVKLKDAQFGDTVILWRGSPSSWQGHVGGLVGWSSDRSKVYLLGGNQGNEVKIAAYDANRIKGIRRSYFKNIFFAPGL